MHISDIDPTISDMLEKTISCANILVNSKCNFWTGFGQNFLLWPRGRSTRCLASSVDTWYYNEG